MSDRRVRGLSKRLSWLLRHGAPEAGVDVDAAGWAAVADVLAALEMTEDELAVAIRENNKRRLQRDGDRVRASQGHSHAMPVTLEALEASWSPWTGEASLWHGTNRAVLELIRAEGLTAQRRTHVHLAAARDAKVGKRANVQVLLEIDPARLRAAELGIFESPNGVILARRVPPEAITGEHER
jgi:putative RNA 2'-phosphotransferase